MFRGLALSEHAVGRKNTRGGEAPSGEEEIVGGRRKGSSYDLKWVQCHVLIGVSKFKVSMCTVSATSQRMFGLGG